jgi:hypothetical protein
MPFRSESFRRASTALLRLGLWALCMTAANAAARAGARDGTRSGGDTAGGFVGGFVGGAAGERCPLAEKIGARYGSAEFPKVESIRFTVRESEGGEESVRHWIWFPKTDSVSFQGPDPKGLDLQAGYSRRNKWSLGSETVAGIDRLFARDRIALLFPLLLARDSGRDSARGSTQNKLPECRMKEGGWLEVTYPADTAAGGKAYELLAGPDGTLRAWKAPGYGPGSAEGTRYEWSPPKAVDGLPLSLDRTGPKGSRIRFTDIKIIGIKR